MNVKLSFCAKNFGHLATLGKYRLSNHLERDFKNKIQTKMNLNNRSSQVLSCATMFSEPSAAWQTLKMMCFGTNLVQLKNLGV